MKALFKHRNGRLKTSRLTFFVFIILLVCLSSAYKMGKSADTVLLKIEHVFEPQKKETKIKKPVDKVAKTLKHPVPKKPPNVKNRNVQEQIPDVEPGETEKKLGSAKVVKLVEKKAEKSVHKSVKKPESEAKNRHSKELQPIKNSNPQVKTAPELMARSKAATNQAVEKVINNKINRSEQDQVKFTLEKDLKLKTKPKSESEQNKESMQTKQERPKTLKLSSEEYFEVYKQWQDQGKTLDMEKALVNLRILNLENVYDLFQMKAVVIRNGKPHTDLGDNSRIANASLSEFSSTCFVVSNPWKKWGDALKDAGFSKNDIIEVRYYTYEFVRNSIYARAQKAFEWSAASLNLPGDSVPLKADVLGRVYAVNKIGGGAFGVFVPLQVDFQSHESVEINPLVCFKEQKDIQALNTAGLLNH